MASDWPRTFFTARLFLFSISLLFVNRLYKVCRVIKFNRGEVQVNTLGVSLVFPQVANEHIKYVLLL